MNELSAEAKKLLGVANDHEWRKKKRAQVRELELVAWEFICGAAYSPASEESMKILNLVREARQKLSVYHWGK